MIDLQELRRLAEMASRGKWTAGHSESGRPIVFDDNMDRIVYGSRIVGSYRRDENDTIYIAFANPSTIIALIDRLEAAEKVCSLAKYSQHDFNCDYVTPRMIDEPCSCGAWKFNKALQKWQKVKEASNDV